MIKSIKFYNEVVNREQKKFEVELENGEKFDFFYNKNNTLPPIKEILSVNNKNEMIMLFRTTWNNYLENNIMKLDEFIDKFICPNTLIRLWVHLGNSQYRLLTHNVANKQNDVCMEHEIINNKTWQSDYKDKYVIGVTDIDCHDSFYREAINIVIKE